MTRKRAKKSEYTGYKVHGSKVPIDVLDFKSQTLNGERVDITKEWFWNHYINLRKPVVLKNANAIDLESFAWDNIEGALKGGDPLQVEELVSGGFGSGKKRLLMSFEEFKKRCDNGECLYMTTQYTKDNNEHNEGELPDDDFKDDFEDDFNESDFIDDDDNNEDPMNTKMKAGRQTDDIIEEEYHNGIEEEEEEETEDLDLEEIYQPPLDLLLLEDKTKLIKPIPLPILQGLSPQQINLWMGVSKETTLNVNVKDNKITINKGLPHKATSSGLHHDHADNLYTLVEGAKTFRLWSPDCVWNFYTKGDVRTVYHTGIIDYVRNSKAPNWLSLNAFGEQIDDNVNEPLVAFEGDPPSFSEIPPALLHMDSPQLNEQTYQQLNHHLKSEFPKAAELVGGGITVNLVPGDSMYLPAGWFHEVSSSSKHIAVNHWFHVPHISQ